MHCAAEIVLTKSCSVVLSQRGSATFICQFVCFLVLLSPNHSITRISWSERDENARIPTRDELEKDEHIGFLDPVKDREIIEYQKFHNKIISDTVLYFASRAQKVLNHNKLVGLFYGYMLEMRVENIGTDETEIFCENTVYGYKLPKDYAFSSPDGVCRGVYGKSGKPALIENKKDGYTVIFSGLGNMHEDVLRSVASRAGVHIFTSDSSAVFTNSAFVGIYKPFGDFCDLKMKKDGAYGIFSAAKSLKQSSAFCIFPLKKVAHICF